MVDLVLRDEAFISIVDRDRLGSLDLDQQVVMLRDLVAARLVGRLDNVAGLLIDELLPKAVAGLPVDLLERDPLGRRGRRIDRDRARDQ